MFNNYKDMNPRETVYNIRKVLYSMEILVVEKLWLQPYTNIYSCIIQIVDTEIRFYGKGISADYCLASAYGEMIEEINTGIIFASLSISTKTVKKFKFKVDPLEKELNIKEYFELPISFKKSYPFQQNVSTFDFFNKYVEKSIINDKFIVLPFYDILNNENEFIPLSIVTLINGSNGICAGNTKEEAIVHGLCEIMERYSVKMHFLNYKIAPIIPKELLKKYYDSVYQMIREIEEKGTYKIIVKDCSLQEKIPVIAIILINKNLNKYLINFGCDLDLEIALQRCITEIFQCKGDIANHMVEMKFTYKANYTEYNKFIKNGNCVWPYTFFLSNEETLPQFKNYQNNTERLKAILNCFERLGANNVYIRECNYIALKTYQIIVPGYSEVFSLPDEFLNIYEGKENIEYLKNLQNLNESELLLFAKNLEIHIMYRFHGNKKFIQDYINIQFDDLIWDSITIEGILFCIYLKLNKYKESYIWLNKFIEVLTDNEEDSLEYYIRIQDALKLKINNYDLLEIKNILHSFYRNDEVEETIRILKEPDTLLAALDNLECFECKKCKNIETCNYSKIDFFYNSVMRRKSIVSI